MTEQILELSDEFNVMLDMMELTNHHLFITGRAGTGKSTLLQLFRNTSKKNIVVLAPTGVAALNVKGQTIHSFFGLPPRLINKFDIHKKRKGERTLLKKINTIIIDEISMVRAEVLDNIDFVLRLNREVDEPFGGVQMIFFGDLFQLPPIVATEEEKSFFKTHYRSAYFFSSHIIKEIDLKTLELTKIYRQTSKRFIKLLECIRTGSVDYEELDELNERYGQLPIMDKNYITLSTRNAVVDSINNSKLVAIDTKEYLYNAIITGAFDPRIYPVEAGLKLKKGAQVMFLKNDPQKKYVNGTIGTIVSIDDESIKVAVNEASTQEIVKVEPTLWETIKYKTADDLNSKIEFDILGTFKQYPLRLAWAITIHKSQGKTFEYVMIDMGTGAFEHGQTYVALSRCKTLEGIILKQPLKPKDVIVDEIIVDYYNSIR